MKIGRKSVAYGPVDMHVGKRVRIRRRLLDMSQADLGVAIGLTFQQIQKYERGANRISASVLFQLSEALEVPISFFFDDMPDALKKSNHMDKVPAAPDLAVFSSQDAQDLLSAYGQIKDPKLQRSMFELAKSLARASAAE